MILNVIIIPATLNSIIKIQRLKVKKKTIQVLKWLIFHFTSLRVFPVREAKTVLIESGA